MSFTNGEPLLTTNFSPKWENSNDKEPACVFLLGGPAVVQAESDWVVYKPGVVKAAVAKGDTVLLGYLSTW